MFLACFARPILGFVELDGASPHRSSNWNAADSAPSPCTDTVRAAQLQRLWLGQLKSRHAVACTSNAPDGIVAVVQPLDGEPIPRRTGPTLLAHHVRLQL